MSTKLDYWKSYEIQKPNGSWTTVQALLDVAVVEALEKLKTKAEPLHDTEDFVRVSDIDSSIAALSKREQS